MNTVTFRPELNALLEHARSPLIIAHKHPDADAVGSALGWYRVLRENGFPDTHVLLNNAPGATLQWLPGAGDIAIADKLSRPQVEELLHAADLLFFLDFNTPSRIGKPLSHWVAASQKAHPLRPVVMIDHHPDPDLACTTLCVSEPFRSATAEVLCTLLGLPGTPCAHISPQSADCLLTGIAGDTGLFAHNCNRAELFHITAALIEAGADKERITREVFRSDKIGRQQLLGYILNEKIHYCPEIKSAFFALSQAELDRFGLEDSDIDGLVNYPLSARGIEISVFMRENPSDGVKISFRSEGSWPVNKLAEEAFGGGGHLNAAGAEYRGSLEQAQSIAMEQTRLMVEAILSEAPRSKLTHTSV